MRTPDLPVLALGPFLHPTMALLKKPAKHPRSLLSHPPLGQEGISSQGVPSLPSLGHTSVSTQQQVAGTAWLVHQLGLHTGTWERCRRRLWAWLQEWFPGCTSGTRGAAPRPYQNLEGPSGPGDRARPRPGSKAALPRSPSPGGWDRGTLATGVWAHSHHYMCSSWGTNLLFYFIFDPELMSWAINC